MAEARIYQKPKSSMSSGRANTDRWILEWAPTEKKRADPLTGWAGSGDTQEQVSLGFPSLEAAQAYAQKHAIVAHVVAAPKRVLKLQAYADNFR